MRRLIVNADDFGFTRDVNSGIIEAHRRGILTATTLMANGSAFDDAVRWSREAPELDVGCHLVLVGGQSLIDGRHYPNSVPRLIRAILSRDIRPYDELRAQILRITGTGIRPSHLDTHKHTHLFPPVLEAVARLSEEFGIPWVRRPFDIPIRPQGTPVATRLISRSLQVVRRRVHRTLGRRHCRTTDHFAGFQMTGRLDAERVIALIRALPEGLTEFMTHPGHHGPELESARTRLKASRQQELEALTDPRVRRALDESGVELTRYSVVS